MNLHVTDLTPGRSDQLCEEEVRVSLMKKILESHCAGHLISIQGTDHWLTKDDIPTRVMSSIFLKEPDF